MKNQAYEQALNQQGVEWVYEDAVLLEDIDTIKGLRNQARLVTPLDEELINHYQQLLKGGSEPPAVVLWEPGTRRKRVPIDGNNRLEVLKREGRKQTDAYVVKTQDPVVVDRLTWTWNNLVNGKRLSREECLAHALTFVQKYGMEAKQAAKEWGLSPVTLSHALRSEQVNNILARRGVKGKLDPSHAKKLSFLETSGEDVLSKAAEVVINCGLTQNQTDDLVREIKAAKSSEQKQHVLDVFTTRPDVVGRKAETKGGRVVPKPLPRTKLITLLKQLERLFEDFQTPALRPTKVEFKQMRAAALAVTTKLTEVFGLGMIPDQEVS